MRDQKIYQPEDGALEALARLLYPAICSYFESEEGRKEFAKWQAKQGAKPSPGQESSTDEKKRLAA